MARDRRRRRFAASPLAPKVLRVPAEVTDPHARTAGAPARALPAGVGSARGRPVPPHGEEGGAWTMLRLAGRLRLATRIGVEDTLLPPDGRRASSDAQSVVEGLYQYGCAQRSS